MPNLMDLPIEMFFNIFPYLPEYDLLWNVGFVSKELHLYTVSFIKSLFIDEDYKESSTIRSKDEFISLLRLIHVRNNVSHIIYRNEPDYELVEELKQNIELNELLLEIKESREIKSNYKSLSLPDICKQCNSVKELTSIRTNISPLHIAKAVSYLKELRVLILFCKENQLSLTDKDVINSLSKCIFLEVIVLMDHNKITDNAIISISKSCKDLRSLNIHGCNLITDHSIVELAKNCPLIRSLDMYGCDRLTDQSLISIAKYLEAIEEIDVGKCSLITDEGVLAISLHCKLLVSFDGSNCSELSDDSVMNLATNCKELEFLAFEFCEKITNNCVEYLKMCKNLKHLDLNGCCEISNKWWLIPPSQQK